MGMNQTLVTDLSERAREIRRDAIEMVYRAQSGHLGGSLSAADILAVLYFGGIMRHDAAEPQWKERDRFILSKGHAAPALYAALAIAGYFPKARYRELRQVDGALQGHPVRGMLPGIETSTGSLGQGLSVGAGMSLGAKLLGQASHVFVLLGDGELAEGQVWEAAAFVAHHRLSSLTAIIDANGYQTIGAVTEVLNLEPLIAKWEAFGWYVREVDGHDVLALHNILRAAREARNRPTAVIARTVKGKGVSFMEQGVAFHGRIPTRDEHQRAMEELS